MLSRLRQHWERGQRYQSRGTWALETYHRVMSNVSRNGWWPGRGRIIKLNLVGHAQPFFVRLGTSDFTVMDEIFSGHEYDRFIASIKDEVRTIVDLGANIGMSLQQWQEHFPNAQVVAVEPDAGNVELIRLNSPHAHVIQSCVAGSNRTVHLDRTRGAWGYQLTDATNGDSDSVPAMTMIELLKIAGVDGPIDLLKCDIEGAEREIFADCREWIGRVRNMVIELHAPYTADDLRRDIERGGKRFEIIIDPGKEQLVMLLASE